MNNNAKPEPEQTEAIKRIKEKSKEIRSKKIVPPIDEEEPTGRLSGGPDSLDLPESESDD